MLGGFDNRPIDPATHRIILKIVGFKIHSNKVPDTLIRTETNSNFAVQISSSVFKIRRRAKFSGSDWLQGY